MENKEGLQCPHCGSKNTKFSYYSNQNKALPRHLCRNCQRGWTVGGRLRKVSLKGGQDMQLVCWTGEATPPDEPTPLQSSQHELSLQTMLTNVFEKVMEKVDSIADLDSKIRKLTKEKEMKVAELSQLRKTAAQLEETIRAAQELSGEMEKEKESF